jgi:hypothetical protein
MNVQNEITFGRKKEMLRILIDNKIKMRILFYKSVYFGKWKQNSEIMGAITKIGGFVKIVLAKNQVKKLRVLRYIHHQIRTMINYISQYRSKLMKYSAINRISQYCIEKVHFILLRLSFARRKLE